MARPTTPVTPVFAGFAAGSRSFGAFFVRSGTAGRTAHLRTGRSAAPGAAIARRIAVAALIAAAAGFVLARSAPLRLIRPGSCGFSGTGRPVASAARFFVLLRTGRPGILFALIRHLCSEAHVAQIVLVKILFVYKRKHVGPGAEPGQFLTMTRVHGQKRRAVK